ncbi:MAG: hypothetical protein ACR2PX_27480 [Endozoicomonas sp.]|uniref:hypothetical protein n=1 Tax=Endozoicomonas sp. TaxID=1892382 RepID=UPI003D9BE57A
MFRTSPEPARSAWTGPNPSNPLKQTGAARATSVSATTHLTGEGSSQPASPLLAR